MPKWREKVEFQEPDELSKLAIEKDRILANLNQARNGLDIALGIKEVPNRTFKLKEEIRELEKEHREISERIDKLLEERNKKIITP